VDGMKCWRIKKKKKKKKKNVMQGRSLEEKVNGGKSERKQQVR
jgi:hypothetical protein